MLPETGPNTMASSGLTDAPRSSAQKTRKKGDRAFPWLSTAPGFREFAPLFALLFAVAAVPVLLNDTLPLFDYPNHLARMHILADLTGSADLQRYYMIVWRPLPNLAMDAIVPALARVMPLAWAGKAFVLTTFFLLAGGAAVLHRMLFGRWSTWSCLAFLLLYNRTLLWGFLNYLFGVGLGLFALALWIALARQPRALRLAVGTGVALMLFFTHLLAFGLYGVMVMGYEAGLALRRRPWTRRAVADLLLAGASFLPALAILFLASPGSTAGAVRFGRPDRKLDLLFSVFDNYHRAFDISCFALVVVAVAIAFWRRWVRLAPAIAAPLASLVLVYLAMPNQLATASGADHRIPLLLGLVLFAGSEWAVPWPGMRRVFIGAGVLLFLARVGVVAASWHASDRLYAELLPALDEIPRGSRVAVAYPSEAINSEATPLTHFPVLAVLRRDAFVPTLFAAPTQQPVALLPPYREVADGLLPERLWSIFVAGGAPLERPERAVLAAYDYIVFLGRRPFTLAAPTGLDGVFASPRFAIYHVSPSLTGSGGAEPPQ
jgi:hypothetical protein